MPVGETSSRFSPAAISGQASRLRGGRPAGEGRGEPVADRLGEPEQSGVDVRLDGDRSRIAHPSGEASRPRVSLMSCPFGRESDGPAFILRILTPLDRSNSSDSSDNKTCNDCAPGSLLYRADVDGCIPPASSRVHLETGGGSTTAGMAANRRGLGRGHSSLSASRLGLGVGHPACVRMASLRQAPSASGVELARECPARRWTGPIRGSRAILARDGSVRHRADSTHFAACRGRVRRSGQFGPRPLIGGPASTGNVRPFAVCPKVGDSSSWSIRHRMLLLRPIGAVPPPAPPRGAATAGCEATGDRGRFIARGWAAGPVAPGRPPAAILPRPAPLLGRAASRSWWNRCSRNWFIATACWRISCRRVASIRSIRMPPPAGPSSHLIQGPADLDVPGDVHVSGDVHVAGDVHVPLDDPRLLDVGAGGRMATLSRRTTYPAAPGDPARVAAHVNERRSTRRVDRRRSAVADPRRSVNENQGKMPTFEEALRVVVAEAVVAVARLDEQVRHQAGGRDGDRWA